ncbi:hypothetical protein AB0I28_34680 [Phytomonospora sp. NPDC050363]|uniref:hypothetical protein n=1 Tax=Phytomonospora sp. NPDC050363 TaxID=3155642 RepID=UPI0033FF2923
MTKDIRELLDETARHDSLTAFDADAAVKRGHGALGRRKFAIGGLTTGVVAVIAAAMVALPGVTAPTGGGADPASPGVNAADPSVDTEDTQRPEGLPKLDPEKYYTWIDDGLWDQEGNIIPFAAESTESTAKYDEAFFDLIDEKFGGFTEGPTPTEFGRMETQVISGAEPYEGTSGEYEIVAHRLIYRLNLAFVNGQTDDGLIAWGKDKGPFERVRVDVRVPDQFTTGVDGPADDSVKGNPGFFDVIGCSDRTDAIQAGQTREIDVTCREKTTGIGERYIEVTEVADPGGEYEMTETKLVLYRADGSAVVVTDTVDTPGMEQTFDFGQLLQMATALPLEPVQ